MSNNVSVNLFADSYRHQWFLKINKSDFYLRLLLLTYFLPRDAMLARY